MIFYTVEEIAEILKLDAETIRRYLVKGDLKGAKIGRSWRVTKDELDQFINDRKN